jgi:hypothetical protein
VVLLEDWPRVVSFKMRGLRLKPKSLSLKMNSFSKLTCLSVLEMLLQHFTSESSSPSYNGSEPEREMCRAQMTSKSTNCYS